MEWSNSVQAREARDAREASDVVTHDKSDLATFPPALAPQ
jgi:hypothetical protein